MNINKIEQTLIPIIRQISQNCLMPYFTQAQVSSKADGSLVTQADIAVQSEIQKQLKIHYPEYDFFAEELSDTEKDNFFTADHRGFWCLDPLDGTSNFANGLPFFAISLALVINGETRLGIVYDPILDECFTAIKGQGAKLNEQSLRISSPPENLQQCIAIIDHKRLDTALSMRLITDSPFHSQRSFGAAALEWCWLAAGRCQVYLHGKHMLWDYAAGLLIAQEAGCVACTLENEPVFELSICSRNIVAAVDSRLFEQWKNIVQHKK